MRYSSLLEQVGNATRLLELLQVLVSNGFAHLVRASGLTQGLPAKVLTELKILHAPSGEPETVGRRMRRVLEQLGPTFVKLGQVLSTRPDLLPEDICEQLANLQDKVALTPFPRMEEVVRSELGAEISALFASFDPEPIAAASISQVYRATLADGTPVAVKIQRPGLAEVIASDLRLMRSLAEWLAANWDGLEWTDPVATVDEFDRSIHRELDFNQERRVLERFAENFADDEHVLVPRVYPDRSAQRVLTMDWIDGVRVDARDQYPARDSDPEVVARLGVAVVCRMVFEHRFFHADPHPGNIVLTRSNHVCFLDYGMVGHLAERDVEAMADLLRAVMEEDADACVRTLQTFTTSGYLEDPRSLQHEVSEYLAFEAHAILDSGQVGRAIEALTAILRRHRLELAPRFTLLLKALATIESTAHRLSPGIEIVPILRPFIEDLVLRRFTPSRLAARAEDEVRHAARLLRTLPDDLQTIAGQLRRGRLRMAMHVDHLRDLAQVVDRASSRLSFAVVMGALIMGSSQLLATEEVAKRIGVAGLVGAAVLGVWLAVSTSRLRLD